jgi:hypothetical protein
MTFVVGQPPDATTEIAGAPPRAPAPEPIAHAPAVAGSDSAGEVAAMVSSAPRPEGRRAPPAAAEVRILIPAGEADALMAFVASIPPGAYVSEGPPAEAESAAPVAALLPITITAIEIVPLDLPAHPGT